MARRTAANIAFPGNAAEALTYYHSLLGGELEILRYSDFPEMDMGLDQAPPADAVAHGEVRGEGLNIAGGDDIMGSGAALEPGNFSLLNLFDSVGEARDLWERFLSTGSTEAMAFEPAPWGGHYGILTDPFGVQWHFAADDAPTSPGQ